MQLHSKAHGKNIIQINPKMVQQIMVPHVLSGYIIKYLSFVWMN